MQDRDVVAAVVAGDADGIAEAYNRYAVFLAAYCHSMLPGPEAAEVVLDTFLIAVSRLDGLRDPDRLSAWLHAVARNECLRRLGPQGSGRPGILVGGATAATWAAGPPDPDDLPAAALPAELRGQVLTACADNSPTGRAHRVSVAHRAGAFGPSGFPKAVGAAGPRWWQGARRGPRPVAAMAVLAAVVAVAAAAVITMIATADSSHRSQASALGFGGGPAGMTSSATPGSASAASSPTHKPAASARPSTPPVTTPASPPSPIRPSMMVTVTTPKPSPSRPSPSRPSPSAPPSPSPSPSPTPSPSTSPAPGHLLAAPASLALTAAAGKTVSGTFLLTAVGGPVSEYTITVPVTAGKIMVAPTRGSLPAGGFVSVTVTMTSKVALNTAITVQPGDLTVRVVLKIKA